jgi:hypothetical protein
LIKLMSIVALIIAPHISVHKGTHKAEIMPKIQIEQTVKTEQPIKVATDKNL